MKLKDLIPKSSCFKLMQFPDKEFRLKPCTGGKLVKMSEVFGDVEKMLALPSAENISKIAFFLMEYDDSLVFKKQLVKYVDPFTGDEIQKDVGGYSLLMDCINGIDEQMVIYSAILLSFGYDETKTNELISRFKVEVDRILSGEEPREEIKKKTTNKKVK